LTRTLCGGVADKKLGYGGGSVWHSVPHGKQNYLYESADTFTIVRNPYERTISTYYYEGKRKPMYVFNRKSLNDFILYDLKYLWRAQPQSVYVFNENSDKVIDHVLHFETLETDGKFEALMKNYNLNITFPKHPVNSRSSGKKLTIQHMHKYSLGFINEFYDRDFINFGYRKVNKTGFIN